MKKSLLTLVLLTAGALPADVFTSPNGRVACDFALRDGVPLAVVSYDGRRVFESELGFNRAKLEVLDTATRTVKGAWKPVWGFKAEYPENYVEQTVRLKRPGAVQTDETLELRCYDEGFAVRAKIVLNVYGSGEIKGERTCWRFAEGAKAWSIPGTESTFPAEPYDLKALEDREAWRMPFTVEIPGVGSASILEANVRDYPRSYLRTSGGAVRPVFALGTKEGRGEVVSPWRAVQLAADVERESVLPG